MKPLENLLFLAFMRRFWPVLRLPKLVGSFWKIDQPIVLLFRRDDCLEVLGNPERFPVCWGRRIEAVSQGHNFLLGIDEQGAHAEIQRRIMKVFRRTDVQRIARICAHKAEELVDGAASGFDAVEGLVTRTAVEVCEKYYGIPCTDEAERFAHNAVAIARYTFIAPGEIREYRDAAERAADEMRELFRRARPESDKVLGRLQKEVRDEKLVAADLLGMVQGFVPTNTLAGAAILNVLFERPAALAQAQAAAQDDDDERLRRCLFEANRFSPLGPRMRHCPHGHTFARAGPGRRSVPPGTRVFAVLKSAMFDAQHVRRPNEFDPDRPDSDRLLFGWGLHWCVGAFLAEAHITHSLKPLLRKRNLRRLAPRRGDAPRGAFPAPVRVSFDLQP